MEKNNKRKAALGENVEGRRVLLVAGAENPDGILHDLIKVLEDHSCEGTFCYFSGIFFLYFLFLISFGKNIFSFQIQWSGRIFTSDEKKRI